ncbi:hypothetical protein PC128_g15213 [Phytophthora cactorum]|nr:hypothetical protein PC120_g9892 [Phytophthora cactorum]KAG3060519.1 hypothetical protein PC121_g13437 [Phytophthora cactorum]KAG3181333.1 hypothetical protein PC128_g15213 [Phytophthora cactorum]KAG4052601.1 hypothetical protein PC123_g12228 [Phytophthora cactorum]
MVTLFCVIVGVARSPFPVDIDARLSVGHLKKAIAERQRYDFAVSELQLFLAKKDGVRMTVNEVKEGVSDTTGLKQLLDVDAKLHTIGLSAEQLNEVGGKAEAVGNGRVNVLVVAPSVWL